MLPGEAPRDWRRVALALLVVVHACLAGPIGEDLRVRLARGTYAEERRAAFSGVDLDAVRGRLDALIPSGTAVALAPALGADEFFRQRFTEGLYPHTVDPAAGVTLTPVLRKRPRTHRFLGELGEHDLVLAGALPDGGSVEGAEAAGGPLTWTAPAPRTQRDVASLLAASVGLAGLGFGLAWWLRAGCAKLQLGLPEGLLVGGLGIGVLASLATWTGFALRGPVVTLAGVVLGGVALARMLRDAHNRPVLHAALRRSVCSPGNWALVLFALALAWYAAGEPVHMWDARSIWLFQAHRLWEHGRLVAEEVAAPWVAFSHPDYPLLFPAWMAHASGLAPTFDERLAGLGAALLTWTLVAVFVRLLARRSGAAAAALLGLGICLELEHVLLGGYPDGALALLLAIELLALTTPGQERLGIVAACAATLLKLEGLPLALVILCVARLAGAGTLRSRLRALALVVPVVALPALAHLAWTRSLGLASVLKGKGSIAMLAELPERLGEALASFPTLLGQPGYNHVRALLPIALVLAIVTPLLCLRRGIDPGARPACVAALLAAAGAFGAVALLPDAVPWLVETALDRLLLHSEVLVTLAAFLSLRVGLENSAERDPWP